jgi:hypothetical protein
MLRQVKAGVNLRNSPTVCLNEAQERSESADAPAANWRDNNAKMPDDYCSSGRTAGAAGLIPLHPDPSHGFPLQRTSITRSVNEDIHVLLISRTHKTSCGFTDPYFY